MFPVSERFLDALQDSHDVTTRVEVLVGGLLAEVFDAESDSGVLGGSVTVDMRAQVRRRLTMSIADADYSLVPRRIGSLLAPPNEIRVSQGIRFGPGDEELVPLGVFGISKPTVDESDGGLAISLDGYDRSRRVSRAKWEVPWVITRGTNVATAIARILADRVPTLPPLNAALTAATTPLIVFGDDGGGDPWKDAATLASDNGLELLIDPVGIPVLRPAPDPSRAQAVARYAEGADASLLASAAREFDDEPGTNGVIVVGEGSEIAEPFRVIIWDDDPTSPTYYLGPWGKVPEYLVSELILTVEQALISGRALLRSRLGTVETVRFSSVGNPAHDGGDVVDLYRPRLHLDARYLIEQLTIPLGPGTMEASCRPRVVTT